MKDKSIIRAGDKVQVTSPLQFVRCGYPKTPKDFEEEAEMVVQRIERNKWPVEQMPVLGRSVRKFPTSVRRKLIDTLSYALCSSNHFGGSERKIYTVENTCLIGPVFTVQSVRTVVTGTYYPASGGWNSYTMEDDYEPAGLGNTKSHRIACLSPQFGFYLANSNSNLEIEVCHLKKVEP